MQAAQDRYNRGKVYMPVIPTAASKDYQSMQQQAAGSQAATGQATSATPAAAVKGPGGNGNSNALIRTRTAGVSKSDANRAATAVQRARRRSSC